MQHSFNYRIAQIAVVLAFIVVVLGAYTRLTHAGLGCPDWPGCYGQAMVPGTSHALNTAQQLFPGQVVEQAKAWTEMIHRYVAGILGLLITVLAIGAFVKRRQYRISVVTPVVLLGMLGFQAALGMWTVTWKLMPLVVMGHLLGGLTILSMLCWLMLNFKDKPQAMSQLDDRNVLRLWTTIAFAVLFIQIALGGWTSANYASLVCPGFPMCLGQLNPTMNFHEAFQFLMPVGANYDGGTLHYASRVAIQMTHRLGAVVTILLLGWLSVRLAFSSKYQSLNRYGISLLALLCAQALLGVLNVVWMLPLPVAVLHNGIAAALLAVLVALNYRVYKG